MRATTALLCGVFLGLAPVAWARRSPTASAVPNLGKRDDLSQPVRSITCNSIVLPKAVLIGAARSSGIHSTRPPADATAQLAGRLNAWYQANGYLFAKVTARSLVRDGRLHLEVSEPRVAREPVQIKYYTLAKAPAKEASEAAAAAAAAAANADEAGAATAAAANAANANAANAAAPNAAATPPTPSPRPPVEMPQRGAAGIEPRLRSTYPSPCSVCCTSRRANDSAMALALNRNSLASSTLRASATQPSLQCHINCLHNAWAWR